MLKNEVVKYISLAFINLKQLDINEQVGRHGRRLYFKGSLIDKGFPCGKGLHFGGLYFQ